jgi:hypothetical protein
MDCAIFDALWKRARGRCEICDVPSAETPHGVLHIDHDYKVSLWGVRGLLCSRCNTSLHYNSVLDPQRVAAYVANPWWKHILETHGVPAEGIPEPEIGSVVSAGGKVRWERTPEGWKRLTNQHWQRGKIEPWHLIIRSHGPHRIRIVVPPVERAA